MVASGGGAWANSMIGAKVGFSNLSGDQGSYSEFVTAGFTAVFSMPANLPVEVRPFLSSDGP